MSVAWVLAGLDASQLEAVKLALSSQDIALVHGPPGTGEHLISRHVCQHCLSFPAEWVLIALQPSEDPDQLYAHECQPSVRSTDVVKHDMLLLVLLPLIGQLCLSL